MGVPEVIRKVTRPKNTVVIDYGEGHGNLRYAVRERVGVRYVPHGNPQPINGRVIGHIINGAFVPVISTLRNEPDFLSFGPSAFGQKINRKDRDDGSNTVGFVRFCRDAGGGSIEGAGCSGNGRSAELSE